MRAPEWLVAAWTAAQLDTVTPATAAGTSVVAAIFLIFIGG